MDESAGSSVGLLNRIERINIEKIFSMLCRWVSLGLTGNHGGYCVVCRWLDNPDNHCHENEHHIGYNDCVRLANAVLGDRSLSDERHN